RIPAAAPPLRYVAAGFVLTRAAALRRFPAKPAPAALPDSIALKPLPGSSAQTPRPPASAIRARARPPTGFPRAGLHPSARCRLRCRKVRLNPKAQLPLCAALPALPARCTTHTSSKSRSRSSIRRAASILRGTRARFAAARTKPHRKSALPSCFLPRSEEHTSELQSLRHLVCRLLLE